MEDEAPIGHCDKCGAPAFPSWKRPLCRKCGSPYSGALRLAFDEVQAGTWTYKPTEKDQYLLTVGAPASGTADRSSIASVLTLIGWLDIIGGFVCAYAFWPGSAPSGYEWQTVKYATPLTWLCVGIVSGTFSLAIAEGLTYLARIADRLDRLQKA